MPETCINTGFRHFCTLLKLAESGLIQVIPTQLSILFRIDKSHLSTHYFSFHIFLVPIQYHCTFLLLCVVLVACRSINKELFSQINIYMLLDFQKKNQTLIQFVSPLLYSKIHSYAPVSFPYNDHYL